MRYPILVLDLFVIVKTIKYVFYNFVRTLQGALPVAGKVVQQEVQEVWSIAQADSPKL
jgi:hypothetical protein